MVESQLAIVIPAHNEERTIFDVVAACSRYGKVVVVNDLSNDATSARAKQAGAEVIDSPVNVGYDAAITLGIDHVVANRPKVKWIVTVDADGQHPVDKVPEFVSLLSFGASIVIGQRPTLPRLGEVLSKALYSLFSPVEDPFCGMKGYAVEIIKENGHFDCYGSIGTELLILCLRRRIPVSVVPIEVSAREDKPRFGSSWRADFKLIRATILGLTFKGH